MSRSNRYELFKPAARCTVITDTMPLTEQVDRPVLREQARPSGPWAAAWGWPELGNEKPEPKQGSSAAAAGAA